jgi:hypothetical protein
MDGLVTTDFDKIEIGKCFRLLKGKALYMKVYLRHVDIPRERMLEISTGFVFPGTGSLCVPVPVTWVPGPEAGSHGPGSTGQAEGTI